MTSIGMGDLAQSYLLRRFNAELNNELSMLSVELTTQETSNPSRHLAGEYSQLAGIERSLKLSESYKNASTEAQLFTTTMQDVLANARDKIQQIANKLLTVSDTETRSHRMAIADEAEQGFHSLVAGLNTEIGGRFIMSGRATDSPALKTGHEILELLRDEISGAANAAEAKILLDDWFSDTGGFQLQAYQGSTNDIDNMPLGDGEHVDIPVRADDEAVRKTLRDFAEVALMDEGVFRGDDEAQKETARSKGIALLARDTEIVELQGMIGSRQETVDKAIARIEAERLTMMQARQALIGVEPYETAMRITETQTQLESLYSITARMSQLTLSNYLR